MQHVGIIHCDLKPENIVFASPENKDKVKVIDFGSSCTRCQEGFTYVQSRYYRCPEILLGLPYTQKADIWSLGCIASEFFSGHPLFPARDESELVEMQDLFCGPFPNQMLVTCRKRDKFFVRKSGWEIIRNKNSRLKDYSRETLTQPMILFKDLKLTPDLTQAQL